MILCCAWDHFIPTIAPYSRHPAWKQFSLSCFHTLNSAHYSTSHLITRMCCLRFAHLKIICHYSSVEITQPTGIHLLQHPSSCREWLETLQGLGHSPPGSHGPFHPLSLQKNICKGPVLKWKAKSSEKLCWLRKLFTNQTLWPLKYK